MRTYMSLEELIEYRRSKELPEEKAERNRKMQERMRETDIRLSKLFRDSIPSQALLDKVISL